MEKAIQWRPNEMLIKQILDFFGGLSGAKARSIGRNQDRLIIKRHEQEIIVKSGEWILWDDSGDIRVSKHLEWKTQ